MSVRYTRATSMEWSAFLQKHFVLPQLTYQIELWERKTFDLEGSNLQQEEAQQPTLSVIYYVIYSISLLLCH